MQWVVYAGLSFFPGSSAVFCCMSRTSAEVLCCDKVLASRVIRKAHVKAPAWRDCDALLDGKQQSECFTCHCWTPNGMLLVGTSGGILKIEGKASLA